MQAPQPVTTPRLSWGASEECASTIDAISRVVAASSVGREPARESRMRPLPPVRRASQKSGVWRWRGPRLRAALTSQQRKARVSAATRPTPGLPERKWRRSRMQNQSSWAAETRLPAAFRQARSELSRLMCWAWGEGCGGRARARAFGGEKRRGTQANEEGMGVRIGRVRTSQHAHRIAL